jgi:adenylyltransferase/sulfurtransferase
MVKNLSAAELKKMMESGNGFKLIDVREKWEYDHSNIDGADLIPLGTFVARSKNLGVDDKIIIYCHHGNRSYSACQYLVDNGFKDVYNLEGGIEAWSLNVDPSVSRY